MEIADYTKHLQEKWEAERQARAQEGLQMITEAGGMESFLKAEFPQLAKLDIGLTQETLASSISAFKVIEERLADCERCADGEGCLNQNCYTRSGERMGKTDAGRIIKAVSTDGEIVYQSCGKWNVRQYRIELKRVGLPPLYHKCTFDNYEAVTEGQKKAKALCQKFSSDYRLNKNAHSVLLAGAWGTGKTHLSAAVVNELVSSGVADMRFAVTPKILAQARASFKDDYEVNPIKAAIESPLLILDDVGAEKITEWVREQLFLLINERYDHELPTIITTNCDMGELENRIGGASVSRIYGMCKGVVVDGEDYRKRR